MFETVVVPVGHLHDPAGAIDHGAAIARQAGAGLELLTVRPSYVHKMDVRRHLAMLADHHGVDAKLTVVASPGDPAAFLALAAADPGTLVCMQTHARRPIAELVLGSTSEQVVRTCRRPVVLVGPGCGPPPERYGSMVVAVDGSDFAEQILPEVRDLSTGMRLTPWLFEVLHAYVPFETGTDDAAESVYVRNLARTLSTEGAEASWETAHDRHPAAAIARFAELLGPALVALTTHGHSPIGRSALGSVAFQVALEAHVPVLVLRPEPLVSEPSIRPRDVLEQRTT